MAPISSHIIPDSPMEQFDGYYHLVPHKKKFSPFRVVTVFSVKFHYKWLEIFRRGSPPLWVGSKNSLDYPESPQQSGILPFSPFFSPQGNMWELFFTFVSNFHWNLNLKIKTSIFGPLDCTLYELPTQNPFPHLPQICLGTPWPVVDGNGDFNL